MKNIEEYVENLCKNTKTAAPFLSQKSEVEKNEILVDIAKEIRRKNDEILSANKLDLQNAEKNGVPKTMIDRLALSMQRLEDIASSIEKISELETPLGKGEIFTNKNGLKIRKIQVPLGVVAIIYEARPNVTYDAAAICIKTGNAVVLRGGKEAIFSNRKAVEIIQSVLCRHGVKKEAVSLLDDITRQGTEELMKQREYVDVLIPRGSKNLIRSVVKNSKIPCIETGAGNCHLYIEADADLDMALRVAINAKTQRPSVCNAIETLLVNKKIADKFLPKFEAATREFDLEIRADEYGKKFLKNCTTATEEDYQTEYNDYIIAVKTLENIDEAIEHINRYGTGHSEAIITKSLSLADRFQCEVDAAAVYVNASTRFTDGGVFGMGAEIGISTQKLHARGPMGLYEMTTTKYLIDGNGQVR